LGPLKPRQAQGQHLVVDGELGQWDAVFDESFPIRFHGGVI
jgi:hypothetical protein